VCRMSEAKLPYVDNLTVAHQERIRALVEEGFTVEQRWAEYAQEFGWGAGGGDPVERAKESVRLRLDELRRLLCSDSAIGKVAASPLTGATIALASVFTGKLLGAQFGGVDVVQLGVLLAQIGLLSICQGEI
jgi:hypothetical protein